MFSGVRYLGRKQPSIIVTMPPKKKAKLSSSNEPEDPIDFVGHIRKKEARKRFSITKGEHNSDIEQNVREVRALLKINAEIFGRCMEFQLDRVYYNQDGEYYTFTRSTFDEVKVRQNPMDEDITELITEQQRTLKVFSLKPLLELPAGLNDLFVATYQAAAYEAFIDYDAFFRTAIMLHDDVLEPFLAKFKQHLESIQVCLGEIESWLLEPKSNIQFLEETFGKKLDILTDEDLLNEGYALDELDEEFECECQVLKTYYGPGRFETTFTIAKACDQQKLKNFLIFMGK
jgi:hypothetical protein